MVKSASETSSRSNFFLLVAVLLIGVFNLCTCLRGIPVVSQGPSLAVSEVTKSLVQRGTLTPKYFTEAYEQLRRESKRGDEFIWQDIFSVDVSGRLLPKHSIFSALIAVPFFLIFGDIGFWIVQQLVLLSLLYAIYVVVRNASGRDLPWTTLVSTLLLSPTLFYSNTFNYDLHGCALVIGGLALSQRFPFFGAMLMTLSVFVRPSHIILALPLLLARISAPTRSEKSRLFAGLGVILLLFFLYNTITWGGPLITSYARVPGFAAGEMVFVRHNIGFDWKVFISDWPSKIIGDAGLLPFNLCLIGVPIVVLSLRGKRAARFQLWCLSTALLYTLYIFSYQYWKASGYGNRFLLPAIYLYLFSFIPAIADLVERFHRRVSR